MKLQFRNKLYIILAMLLAAAVPSTLYIISNLMLDGAEVLSFGDLRGVFVFIYVVSLLLNAIIGLPLFLVVYFLCGSVRSWQSVLTGSLVGTLFLIVLEDISLEKISKDYYLEFLFFGVSGALTGLVFWLVLRLGKVDYRNITHTDNA